MKSKFYLYWAATVLVSVFMLWVAFQYLTRQPRMMMAFASLGYPSYFPTILGIAKLLGVIVLLIPGWHVLKEWAYAGFAFAFIGAFFSHVAAGQGGAVLLPLVSLILLGISYACRPADRRIAESVLETHGHHPSGGVPAR